METLKSVEIRDGCREWSQCDWSKAWVEGWQKVKDDLMAFGLSNWKHGVAVC